MNKYIVGHRGWTAKQKENTLAAFLAAIDIGVDYVECDIRRSADGVLFIHHDARVGSLETAVSTIVQLQKEARTLGYEIPTLTDLLGLPLRGTRIDFELKEPGYEQECVQRILGSLAIEQFVITAFEDSSVFAVKKFNSKIRCGLLLGLAEPSSFATRIQELFPTGRARSVGADFLAPHWQLLRLGFAQRMQAAGLPLWVWTVNDPITMDELLASQDVEAIITDHPDVAVSKRQAWASKCQT
jgi:glycerophosphoryl diester phosphodiesterase